MCVRTKKKLWYVHRRTQTYCFCQDLMYIGNLSLVWNEFEFPLPKVQYGDKVGHCLLKSLSHHLSGESLRGEQEDISEELL